MVRSGYLSNSKLGGVWIYYKESLTLKVTDVKYLYERIVFEVLIGGEMCNLISLYRSPGQPGDIFGLYNLVIYYKFLDRSELILKNVANNNRHL